jgi:uncharacterized protein
VKIRAETIKGKVLDLSAVEDIAEYPALAVLRNSGGCNFPAPLQVRLTVAREFDHIRAEGSVATKVRLTCSRCLEEYDADIDSPFTIFYMPAAAGICQDEEVELTEEDLVSATYEGEEIDLSREIAEQVITEIPVKPLCSEDCKGLCPVCGTDLNVTACGCRDETFSIKFGVLKNLKLEK